MPGRRLLLQFAFWSAALLPCSAEPRVVPDPSPWLAHANFAVPPESPIDDVPGRLPLTPAWRREWRTWRKRIGSLDKSRPKARKQNEKLTRKIEEPQQTLNEILERMGGHPAETPFSGASSSHGAADERDTTSAVGDDDTDMCCGGEYEASVAVGFQRKSPSDSQHFEGAENPTQEPKRARPAGRKIDVIKEMVDKLTNKTERVFETLLIRLNESDAERNSQYAAKQQRQRNSR
ncbi:hypothetical protein MRX96_000355 [Rhipicephalus microplus]